MNYFIIRSSSHDFFSRTAMCLFVSTEWAYSSKRWEQNLIWTWLSVSETFQRMWLWAFHLSGTCCLLQNRDVTHLWRTVGLTYHLASVIQLPNRFSCTFYIQPVYHPTCNHSCCTDTEMNWLVVLCSLRTNRC